MTSPAMMLLACGEAARTGQAANSMMKALLGERAPLVASFVRGEGVTLDEADLAPELRAAACLVRSRNASLPEAERKALLDEVRRLDILRGPVTAAIAAWKT
jgi:hypothetical protein